MKIESKPSKHDVNSVLRGNESEINFLIYRQDDEITGAAVVYVDHDLDIDWECDQVAGRIIDSQECKPLFREVINTVGRLEPIAHNWPKDLKLMSKRLLGESIACAICCDFEGAKKALKDAEAFFTEKRSQVSRYWTIQAALLSGAFAATIGLFEVLVRLQLTSVLGATPYLITLCFWSGCVGATLFLILGLGKTQRVDSTAEMHLHYLEGGARVIAGGIAGGLIGGMVKLGVVLPVFERAGTETLAMCIAAMVAGASERFAAGLITKIEEST